MHRPAHTDQWLAALKSHPEYDSLRSDRKTALLRCCKLLARVADYASMTTRPTWDFLATALGVTRRSVARYLQQLRNMRLLGVVASGRTAKHATTGPDGKRHNEAAVYVLCQPNPQRDVQHTVGRLLGFMPPAVDEYVTPPNVVGTYYSNKRVNPHTRARARGSISKEQRKLGLSPDEIRWNRHWVPTTKAQQRTAAWRLRTMIPHVFRRMSERDLASILKDFFHAGWSVADVHHALDTKPDGTPWPHSGAPNTNQPRRIRGWLKYRLAAWRNHNNKPLKSVTQLKAAQEDQARQLKQLEAEQKAQRQAEVKACPAETRDRILADIRKHLPRRIKPKAKPWAA